MFKRLFNFMLGHYPLKENQVRELMKIMVRSPIIHGKNLTQVKNSTSEEKGNQK